MERGFKCRLRLPFIVAFSLTLAVEVKVDMYEVVKLVVVFAVVVIVLLPAVVEIGVLELFVMCSVEVANAKDVDVDITVVVVEETQVMRRTMMPRRETRKRTRRTRRPIWIRLCINLIISALL